MKKYISPLTKAVELDNEALIAESLGVDTDPENLIEEGEFLSKEVDFTSSRNLWDNEW